MTRGYPVTSRQSGGEASIDPGKASPGRVGSLDGVQVSSEESQRELKPAASRVAGRHFLLDAVLLLALCLLTFVVMTKDISVGGLRYGDTSVHAMDGVLIHDWVAAGPKAWLSPMGFAEQQYGRYPCLGIGRHYPPGFAVVEAGFFALFGISPATARLSVVFFALLLVVGTYTFVRQFASRGAAMLAAVLLMTLPEVTLWGRQAMLEIPTLAVLSWGAVTFCWYLRRPTARRLSILIVVALSALLIRQTGVFLVCSLALTLAYCAWLRRVPPRHFVWCAAIGALAIAGITFSFEGAGAKMFRGRSTYPSLWQIDALTFYVKLLPEQVGWWVLVAAGVGVASWPGRHRTHRVFLLLWFVVSYVMVTAADLKWPRFFFVGLFPIAVFSGVGGWRVVSAMFPPRLAVAAATTVVLGVCAVAWARPVSHRPDYGAVVASVREKIQDRVVLFSGLRDTHFVFAVRQHIPWRRAIVVRGSKLLYSCNAYAEVDFESYVSSTTDIGALIDQYAFPVVFVERENKHGVREDDLLVEYLRGGATYRHAAKYSLKAEERHTYRDVTIDMYELTVPVNRKAQYMDIPIPRSARTIRLDLTASNG